jgi:tetratricopeptide (TPR) repeat protein
MKSALLVTAGIVIAVIFISFIFRSFFRKYYKSDIKNHTKIIENKDKSYRHALSYAIRAYAYHKLGKFDNAISDYSKAIILSPYDPSLYDQRATSFLGKKDYQNAINDYERCLVIAPNYVYKSQINYTIKILKNGGKYE